MWVQAAMCCLTQGGHCERMNRGQAPAKTQHNPGTCRWKLQEQRGQCLSPDKGAPPPGALFATDEIQNAHTYPLDLMALAPTAVERTMCVTS